MNITFYEYEKGIYAKKCISNIFKVLCIYFKGIATDRNLSAGSTSQITAITGGKNFILVSFTWVARAHGLELSLITFPGTLVGW